MSTATKSALSDEELAGLFKAGDDEAFAVLFNRWNERLTRFCLRITGDWHLGEEVVADVFLAFYLKPESYDPQYRCSGWLFRRCRWRALSRRYTQRRRECPGLPVTVVDNTTPTPVVAAVEREDRAEEAANAKAITERLPEALTPTQAEAVIRVYMEGLSMREVAESRGCSHQAIDANLQYAFAKLRVDPVLSSIAGQKKRTPPAPLRIPNREALPPARPSRPAWIRPVREVTPEMFRERARERLQYS